MYVFTADGIPCMNMEVKVISLCFALLVDMVLLITYLRYCVLFLLGVTQKSVAGKIRSYSKIN